MPNLKVEAIIVAFVIGALVLLAFLIWQDNKECLETGYHTVCKMRVRTWQRNYCALWKRERCE